MGRFITAGGGGGGGTVTPPLAFGIGLTQTGLIVDLDPAREAPGEIGGFNEAPADGLLYARVNSAGVAEWTPVTPGGLPFMGANPPPPVPPATQVIAGTLWWRTTNGSLYVYFFDGLNYQWVTASPTGEVVGAPLIFPPAPVVGAVLAATNNVTYTFDGLAWNAEDIGGGPVHIGPLPPVLVAPAVTYEPGTLWWRNDPDGVLFVWYDDGTSSQWVPATPVAVPDLEDAPWTSEAYGRKDGYWVVVPEEAPRSNVIYGRQDGVWVEVEATVNPAGNDPSLIGTVWVPPRSATQGLELLDGHLTAPLATPDMPGVINEPALGDVEHVRVRDIATGQGRWVEARAGNVEVATATTLGVVFVPFNEGLELTLSGGLSLARATPEVIGGLLDAPRDDTGLKTYMRKWGQWVEAEASGVNVATATTLGVIFVPFNEGLELTLSGGLSLARATPEIIGGLLDAPRDDTGQKTYMRKWGEWVEAVGGGGIGDVPPDPPVLWARATGRWVEFQEITKQYVDDANLQQDIMIDRKVFKGGDYMTGPLHLPPGNPTHGYEAAHKNYVDSRVSAGVITSSEPPLDPKDGLLWWDESSAGLYLYYVDPTSSQWIQVNSIAGLSVTDIVSDAPADNEIYARRNQAWEHVDVYGDMKYGFQGSDHRGWVLLDGRAVSALSSTQQLQATALGWTTNVPNAAGVVPMMGGVPGTINGTMLKTLVQANLPNVTLTAESTGAHTHRGHGGITGSALQFEDMGGAGAYENWGGYAVIGDSGNNYMTWQTLVETTGAHEHTVSLGGTDTPIDVTPMNMSVNAFVFLGY